MKRYILTIILSIFALHTLVGQNLFYLSLPNHDQLSSDRVQCMIQDSEGCLWYGTEGGGVCRDDGLKMTVFRSDSQHHDLLGSNNVASIREAGHYIVIGTYHGAYTLDRRDYSIRRLTEVDDKRVDDILVTKSGEVWLTSNKKIYHFNVDFKLLHIYTSQWHGVDAYVAHLHEDSKARIWATQWNGGLLRFQGDGFQEMAWSIDAQPSDIANDLEDGWLWIGTIGQGIVRYRISDGVIEKQPASGNAICIDLQPSLDGKRLWMITMNALSLFHIERETVNNQNVCTLQSLPTTSIVPDGQMVLHRLSMDIKGRLLVAGSEPGPFVVSDHKADPWFDGTVSDGIDRWAVRERQGLIMVNDSMEQVVSPNQQWLPVIAPHQVGGVWITNGSQIHLCTKDGINRNISISDKPTAMAEAPDKYIWYSTGHDIRKIAIDTEREDTVLDMTDVSAMAFTPDGTLWMGTIYGKIYRYKDGKAEIDTYASNERGDAVSYLGVDSLGRLLMACDRYIRLYDIARQTMRQQARESKGVYCIELQETEPGKRWSRPHDEVVERLPQWLTAWWMWCVYALLLMLLIVLCYHNYRLRRQRMRFMEQIKNLNIRLHAQEPEVASVEPVSETANENEISVAEREQQQKEEAPALDVMAMSSPFLKDAIAQVEAHLSDENYNVEQLSSDLCMSRMTFYRRLQTATGQKPTEFVRTIRLRHAAEMLQKGEQSISEISFATGFSSVSYFSRCFRTMFGVSPTQFGKTTTAED